MQSVEVIDHLFIGGMDEGQTYYDYVLEYDDVSWKIIGKMSLARKAHAVSVVQYDDVCPSK